MRKFSYISAIALAAVATPALANEARVELRGGVAWVPGVSTEVIGVALGYDADVGGNVFVGGEVVADTDFDFASPVIGVNVRLGTNVGESTKLFVTGGYARDTSFDLDDAVIGAGAQFGLGSKSFVSVQYQRYLDTDVNRATVGVGFKF